MWNWVFSTKFQNENVCIYGFKHNRHRRQEKAAKHYRDSCSP